MFCQNSAILSTIHLIEDHLSQLTSVDERIEGRRTEDDILQIVCLSSRLRKLAMGPITLAQASQIGAIISGSYCSWVKRWFCPVLLSMKVRLS